jgi:hypothetical protein
MLTSTPTLSARGLAGKPDQIHQSKMPHITWYIVLRSTTYIRIDSPCELRTNDAGFPGNPAVCLRAQGASFHGCSISQSHHQLLHGTSQGRGSLGGAICLPINLPTHQFCPSIRHCTIGIDIQSPSLLHRCKSLGTSRIVLLVRQLGSWSTLRECRRISVGSGREASRNW